MEIKTIRRKLAGFIAGSPPKTSKKGSHGSVILDFPEDGSVFDQGASAQISYQKAATDGYIRNYVCAFVIADIAEKAASIPLKSEDANMQKLLNRPSPRMTRRKWINSMIIDKIIDGQAYAEIVSMSNKITEMQRIQPDKVEVLTGISKETGLSDSLLGYRVTRGKQKTIRILENGESMDPTNMLHTKFHNPLDEHRGLSKLISVWNPIESNNEMNRILKDVTKNDGAVKGFLRMEDSTDDMAPDPDEEEMKEIRKIVNELLGKKNRGKWAVFNRNLKFEKMGQSSKDMEQNKTMEATARQIALGLGFPPILLGFSAGSTFNNVESAELALWTGTIIPLLEDIVEDIELMWEIETNQIVDVTLDKKGILPIQKLMREVRKAAIEAFSKGVMTLEEAREESGLDREPDGQLFFPVNVFPVGPEFEALNQVQGD